MTTNETINNNNINKMINSNNNDNMRCDNRILIRIDDFDIDYSVFPISNRQIDETSHEQALARQEEGRVHEIERSSAYLASKQVIERSIRAVTLTRIRLNLKISSSNEGSKPLPQTTSEALQVHLRLKQAKSTLLKHFQLRHKMQRKAVAIRAAQDACNLKIQRAKARRRLALVSAAAAAVGRSWVRLRHQPRRAFPETSSSCDCDPLSYEDVCKMSTVQLLGLLSKLRDSSCLDLRYALVQGELGARSMETHVVAFHAFLQYEEDKATREIAKSREAVTFEESTDSKQLHHGQAELAQEKSQDGYVADSDDHHDDGASSRGSHIADLESWDPPLLPDLRKHVEWLPINTPSRFYEDLQAMNEFKTEQQARRRSALFRWLVAGIMFAALLATAASALLFKRGQSEAVVMPAVKSTALPLLSPTIPAISSSVIAMPPTNSTRPQYRSDSALSPLTSLKASYSSMIYSSVELLLPPWAFRHPASMALSTIVSPRAIVIFPQATRIAPNITVAESAELRSQSSGPDPVQVKIAPTSKPSLPRRRPLLMMDHAAMIVEHPTVPTNSSITMTNSCSSHALPYTQTAERSASMAFASVELLITPLAPTSKTSLPMMDLSAMIVGHPTVPINCSITITDSCSSHALPCSQTANGFSSMPYASVEILLPPWAYHHPASLTLSTIVSPRVIAISHHQPTTIALNVSESDRLRRSRSTSSSTLPIVMSQQVLIRFAAVPTISQGALLLPQHQHAAALPPPDPPPGLSRSGRFRGCHCGGALPVAYLLESPLPPPEPPPGALVVAVLGLGVCIVLFDV